MNRNGEKEAGATAARRQPTIRFPALAFSQGLVYPIQSLGSINKCSKLGFKRGYYKNLILIDSNSSQFQVVGARKLRTLPLRLRFRDFLELLGANPRWEVDLIFAPSTPQISLDEVKKLISESFKKEKH